MLDNRLLKDGVCYKGTRCYHHILKLFFLFRDVNFVLLFFSNMLRKQELPGIYVIPSAQSSLCKYICVIKFTVLEMAYVTSLVKVHLDLCNFSCAQEACASCRKMQAGACNGAR
jgi:hypothetical protein